MDIMPGPIPRTEDGTYMATSENFTKKNWALGTKVFKPDPLAE